MTEVVLVSCSKSKQEGTRLARNLYEPSSVFRKRREYAIRFADHWGILSAKYGYLRPWQAVETYEMHRRKRSNAWGAWVLDDLLDDLRHWGGDTVRILAGKLYVDPLVAELEARGYDVIDPHRGLMSGQRESRLKEALQPGDQTTLVPDGGFLVPVETWFDADWINCIECRGNGQRVECMDDLCHAQGRCMHDAANNVCSLCGGTGEITKELADRWSSRDSFEAVTAPDPDLWRRGKLHAAARERHDREVQDSDNTAGDDRPGAA